jgi:hypothetical protein
MARFSKGSDGMYNVKGKKFAMVKGSRAQVMHGTAYETSGGLKKHHLKMNKHGRVVSVARSATAKKQKHLGANLQAKGSKHFGPKTKKVRKSKGKKSRKSRK